MNETINLPIPQGDSERTFRLYLLPFGSTVGAQPSRLTAAVHIRRSRATHQCWRDKAVSRPFAPLPRRCDWRRSVLVTIAGALGARPLRSTGIRSLNWSTFSPLGRAILIRVCLILG